MFLVILSGSLLMKGRKRGTDGLEEMWSRDRPESLENVFKGEYAFWAAFKKAMYKSELIS